MQTHNKSDFKSSDYLSKSIQECRITSFESHRQENQKPKTTMSPSNSNAYTPNKPARRGPCLKLDTVASIPSRQPLPQFIEQITIPTMSLNTALEEVSKQPLPHYGPSIFEKAGGSRDALQHSGDAGHHDYLHWALEHNGAKPRNSWDMCGCEHLIQEIDSDESEPITEEELAQRRNRLQETYADLFTSSDTQTVEIHLDESVSKELAEAMDEPLFSEPMDQFNANISLQNENENPRNPQSSELEGNHLPPSVSRVDNDFEHFESITLETAPFYLQSHADVQLQAPRPALAALDPRATSFQMPSHSKDSTAQNNDNGPSLRGGIINVPSSCGDSEHNWSSSRRKGVFVPLWLWCIQWVSLVGFFIGFFIMMTLFIVFRSEGLLHVGKALPCASAEAHKT